MNIYLGDQSNSVSVRLFFWDILSSKNSLIEKGNLGISRITGLAKISGLKDAGIQKITNPEKISVFEKIPNHREFDFKLKIPIMTEKRFSGHCL